MSRTNPGSPRPRRELSAAARLGAIALVASAATLLACPGDAGAAPHAAPVKGAKDAPAKGAKDAPAAPGLPGFQTWTLPNGLTVVNVQRPQLPMVTVQVWYRFGSADEPDGQRGAAHTFERLMFMGSDHVRPGQHRNLIEALGGQTSVITTEDVTAYHDTVPLEYLDTALELEAERMRHLMLQPQALRGVLAQLTKELAQQEASPLYRSYEILLSTAFTTHPYAVPPTGVAADLDKLTVKDIQALYDAYYQPNNALVVVVGGAPPDKVKAAVEHFFGQIPRAAQPKRPGGDRPEPLQTQLRRQELSGSPVGLVLVGYHLPPARDASGPALQVLGAMLIGGPHARLQRLVDRKLAAEVGGQVLAHRNGGLLLAYARAASGQSLDSIEGALLAEIARLASEGPRPGELARARQQVLDNAWFGMESATGLANQLGVAWALEGDAARLPAELDAVAKVSAADVKKAAATYLTRNKATLILASTAQSGPAPGGQP